MMQRYETLIFFLGGYDLEMVTIQQLLLEVTPKQFYDKQLSWGAKASAYAQEVAQTLSCGLTPVFVELMQDLDLQPTQFLVIDHHGEHAGEHKPTSLHQVFDLLGLPSGLWTRWYDLVAANDRGYIPALLEMDATPEEVVTVRAADRAAQGITPAEEAAGERAVVHAETCANGMVTVVRLPHSRTATVTDRLHSALGGKGYQNLLVYCPDQVNFFGTGQLVHTLAEHFPGGWYGGALPAKGFWGHEAPLPDILPVILGYIASPLTISASGDDQPYG